jgi:hypothetical protein
MNEHLRTELLQVIEVYVKHRFGCIQRMTEVIPDYRYERVMKRFLFWNYESRECVNLEAANRDAMLEAERRARADLPNDAVYARIEYILADLTYDKRRYWFKDVPA